jgi:hypothetical protein
MRHVCLLSRFWVKDQFIHTIDTSSMADFAPYLRYNRVRATSNTTCLSGQHLGSSIWAAVFRRQQDKKKKGDQS